MNYQEIRNHIVLGLYSYLNKPVVMLEQTPHKPPYPFIAYKFITPYIPQNIHNIKYEDIGEDIKEISTEQPHMTLSVTAYSHDDVESVDLAQKALEWFSFYGYDHLKEKDIIKVETQAIGNRDTLIVDDYERRNGFDALLRVSNTMSMNRDVIKKIGGLKYE